MQKFIQWVKSVLNVLQGTGRTVTIGSSWKGSWQAGHESMKAKSA